MTTDGRAPRLTSPVGAVSRVRLPLVALALLALLAAMWGGLLRLGWNFPPLDPILSGVHGPLMVSGFLGTVISLERAVALRARWAYMSPVASALGALVLITGLSTAGGAVLVTLGSVGMLAIFTFIVRRQPALFTYTMALGAAMWLAGNLIWLAGFPLYHVALWWSGFLILTIVGERLELSRLQHLARSSEWLYLAAVALLSAGLVVDAVEGIAFPYAGPGLGFRIAGAGMLGLALWLLRYDIARRTVRQAGLTRFIALCLLLGYVWLGIGGLIRLSSPDLSSSNMNDALLHTVFLGFVMSMIFGHAPIILPAVLQRSMPYSSAFYFHLALLHLSLALRVSGDLAGALQLRQWGGLLNVVAILLFLFTSARALLAASANKPARLSLARD
ncbi:MAG: hypothetical protein ACM3JD_12595 [Rudaea sp.]